MSKKMISGKLIVQICVVLLVINYCNCWPKKHSKSPNPHNGAELHPDSDYLSDSEEQISYRRKSVNRRASTSIKSFSDVDIPVAPAKKQPRRRMSESDLPKLDRNVIVRKKITNGDHSSSQQNNKVAKSKTKRSPEEAEAFKRVFLKSMKNQAVSETLILTGESCAHGRGNLYYKKVSSGAILYEVCFDENTLTAIYTKHTLKPFNGKKSEVSRKDMQTSWHPSYAMRGESINKYYNAKHQKEEFDKILGKGQTYVESEIKKSNYYAHAHLVDHGAFVDEEEQRATYELYNCVAGKQSVNNGNWKAVESFGRSVTESRGRDILTFTGVLDQLVKNSPAKTKTKPGEKVKLYLDNEHKRLAIPRIHFKLYVDETTKESVAFFTSNDTGLDEKGVKAFLGMCESKCGEINFDIGDNGKNVKKGLTICCAFRDFIRQVLFLPIRLPMNSKLIQKQL